jgi:hypothetical protein
LAAIACCPVRSPPSLWSRFPGGVRRSGKSAAKSMYSSFRRARRVISGGSRLDRPVTCNSCVCRSANVLITDLIVTRHVTLVNRSIPKYPASISESAKSRAQSFVLRIPTQVHESHPAIQQEMVTMASSSEGISSPSLSDAGAPADAETRDARAPRPVRIP